MAIGNVTISGMASGLPADIVDQLVNAQKSRLKAMERDKSFFSDQQKAVGEFETRMLALQTKAEELQETSAWAPHTVSSSNEDMITASADSTAQAATHAISVTRLATYDVWASSVGAMDPSDTLDAGANFSFTYNGVSYGTDAGTSGMDSASLEGMTLSELADAINGVDYGDEDGVSASVLNDGTQYRLILTARDSGQHSGGDRIAIEGNTALSLDGGAVTMDATSFTQPNGAPTNASLTINGILIESSTNQITDALTGVTLNLKDDTAGSTVYVSVSDDTAAMTTVLNGFVDTYNAVVDYYNQNKNGTLSGETLARSVLSQLRSVLNTPTQSASGDALTPYSTLASIGLRTDQKTGRISFDTSSLEDALSNNFSNITRIFTTSHTTGSGLNEGVAYRMADLIDSLTSSTDGAVTGRKDGLKARIDRLEKNIERENTRLEKVRETLTKKFSNLEQLITRMNSSSTSLLSSMQKLSG
ncbi:MAG: flagellar filament capping protein FliD [Magnetococcales bacterium]|nr:flagellar filament capping protein FliD [Magnetococcales bacterium]